jgi:hypothetical protein
MTRTVRCDFATCRRHSLIFVTDSATDDAARDAMSLARTDRRVSRSAMPYDPRVRRIGVLKCLGTVKAESGDGTPDKKQRKRGHWVLVQQSHFETSETLACCLT